MSVRPNVQITDMILVGSRSDSYHGYVCFIDCRMFKLLQDTLSWVGINLVFKERESPFDAIRHSENDREVIKNIWTVQNMEWKEGESFIPVLEQLIADYARLK